MKKKNQNKVGSEHNPHYASDSNIRALEAYIDFHDSVVEALKRFYNFDFEYHLCRDVVEALDRLHDTLDEECLPW